MNVRIQKNAAKLNRKTNKGIENIQQRRDTLPEASNVSLCFSSIAHRTTMQGSERMASDSIEYMCRFCGKKQMSFQSRGRPEPGHCPRNPRKSGGPHSWSVNRRWKAATSGVKPAPSKMIEYMCRFCGQKKMISQSRGRPEPGHCPRKANGGPHSWIVNRRF